MSIVTFETQLSEQDKNYPEYRYGKIIIQNNKPLFQVYNEKNIKEVNGFNIKLAKPFNKDYRYGRIIFNKTSNRIGLLLMCNQIQNGGFNRKTIWLARYIFQINNGLITDDLHIDHKNGNKLDDRIQNLNCITERHNYQKYLYGKYWLPKFNLNFNTSYQESDLLDKELLEQVIEYTKTIRTKEHKKSKSNYRKIYNKNKKQQISNYNKEHGKIFYQENKEFINKRKWLSSKINSLLTKKWSIMIGKELIINIEKIFSLYDLTIEKVLKGLDITKYNYKTINRLFQLALIYSENLNKIKNV